MWTRLEAEPGFSEDLRQAEADIAAGKGVALVITECPCDCGCLELTEDGGLCIVCRTGIHNADQE